MIRERLWQFLDWLESNVADHEAVLLLQWISDFEAEGDRDEEEYRAFKAFVASRHEQLDAVSTLRVIESFEADHEPEDGLSSFQDWLKAKCGEIDALMGLNWVAEFERAHKESTSRRH